MNTIYKTFLSLSIPLLATGATDIEAKTQAQNISFPRYTVSSSKSNVPFESKRMQQIAAANSLMDGSDSRIREEQMAPGVKAKLGPSELIDDIDTAWGELWYYTANFKNTYIKMSEDYSFPVMQEFEFKIYNSQLEYVGTIKDKIEYKVYEDSPMDPKTMQNQIDLYGPYHRENGVAMCQLAPIITKNYFNLDDKIEIIVSLSVQTTYYHNNDYNRVYQLGGETYEAKDHENNMQTYNKAVTVIPMQLGDVFSNTDDKGKEKTFMTFMADYQPDIEFEFPDIDEDGGDDDLKIPGYWESYCSYAIDADIYRAPIPGEEGIQKMKSFHLPLSKLPGDMQSSPFLISLSHKGKVYFVVSRYEDTFYNPYHSPIDDMSMRLGNNLIVDIYEENADGTDLSLMQTTKIPTYLSPDFGDSKILASYFAVGDFRYRDDINFGEDGKAGLYITKSDYIAGSDDSYLRSYYYYNADGTLEKPLFEQCQSHITMSDIDGFEPQEMFIDLDAAGDYVFHFVDLNSVKEVLTLNYRFGIDEDSDPERLTANIDRVKHGDSYIYADELRVPTQDDEGNDIGRILWFDNKGKYDHIDEINMGKGIYYAMYYIDKNTLNPDYFHVDPQQEYMLLVKRAVGTSRIEELLVAQAISAEHPKGQVILTVSPDENGSLAKVTTDSESQTPHLFVTRVNDDPQKGTFYTWDVYALPLGSSGISETAVESDSILFDGKTVACPGSFIEILSISGCKAACGNDYIDASTLDAGIYIVRAAGKTAKILVR